MHIPALESSVHVPALQGDTLIYEVHRITLEQLWSLRNFYPQFFIWKSCAFECMRIRVSQDPRADYYIFGIGLETGPVHKGVPVHFLVRRVKAVKKCSPILVLESPRSLLRQKFCPFKLLNITSLSELGSHKQEIISSSYCRSERTHAPKVSFIVPGHCNESYWRTGMGEHSFDRNRLSLPVPVPLSGYGSMHCKWAPILRFLSSPVAAPSSWGPRCSPWVWHPLWAAWPCSPAAQCQVQDLSKDWCSLYKPYVLWKQFSTALLKSYLNLSCDSWQGITQTLQYAAPFQTPAWTTWPVWWRVYIYITLCDEGMGFCLIYRLGTQKICIVLSAVLETFSIILGSLASRSASRNWMDQSYDPGELTPKSPDCKTLWLQKPRLWAEHTTFHSLSCTRNWFPFLWHASICLKMELRILHSFKDCPADSTWFG